jgi:signal transduction histidine kinase
MLGRGSYRNVRSPHSTLTAEFVALLRFKAVPMSIIRLLLLQDRHGPPTQLEDTFARLGLEAIVVSVEGACAFSRALHDSELDAVIIGTETEVGLQNALALAKRTAPHLPVLLLAEQPSLDEVADWFSKGVSEVLDRAAPWQWLNAAMRFRSTHCLRHGLPTRPSQQPALATLVRTVHDLSQARDLAAITAVARRAARELTGADGAAFILRDGDFCHYADEDAIEPLWRGQRFPLDRCVSGWVIEHGEPLIIEDIYRDSRVPIELYKPTFVRSLMMVPIRTDRPIGAIGNYWAQPNRPDPTQVETLQALSMTVAVALDSLQVYKELEGRVRDRTLQLESANEELEAFSYSVAHDLRGPLHVVGGYSELLTIKLEDTLDDEDRSYLDEIQRAVHRMTGLIDDLLRLARLGQNEPRLEPLDLSTIAGECFSRLASAAPKRTVDLHIDDRLIAVGDRGMLQIVMENLLSNAWKYTARRERARIEVGSLPAGDEGRTFYVRDNGAGFDARFAKKLFTPFQRLHREEDFEGTGVGLATVERIIRRHGGRIWAEGEVDRGATFFFTLRENAHPVLR